MIQSKDRSGWIGASDTSMVMGRWTTKTFEKWWLEKLGVAKRTLTTPAMQCGTAYEHRILDALSVREKDLQIKIKRLRLRVNFDGTDKEMITEVKTYFGEKFKLTKAYWMQCQVEMFASGYGLFRARKKCRVAAYRITEAEMENFFLPVDLSRLREYPTEYDAQWIAEEYLPRLRYLAKCLKTGRWPKIEEMNDADTNKRIPLVSRFIRHVALFKNRRSTSNLRRDTGRKAVHGRDQGVEEEAQR